LKLHGQLETISSPRRSVPLFNQKRSPLARVLKRLRSTSASPTNNRSVLSERTLGGKGVPHGKRTISKTSTKRVSSKSITKKRFNMTRSVIGDDQVPSKKDLSTKQSKQEIKLLRQQLSDLERHITSLTVSNELINSSPPRKWTKKSISRKGINIKADYLKLKENTIPR